MPAPTSKTRIPWTPAWKALLVGCLVAVGAAEAILLELGATYFSGGFNHAYVSGVAQIAGFFAASTLVDLFLILGLWTLALPLVRRLPLGRLPAFALVGLATLAVPCLYDLLRYKILHVMGRLVSVRSLWELAGGASVAASEVVLQLEGAVPVLVLGAALLAALLWGARAAERRLPRADAAFAPPATRRVALACALAGLAGAAIFALPTPGAARVHAGMVAKPGGRLLLALVRRTSDVDFDGFGLLSRPPDPAPFDGSIHPFALDLPGNGIDENGVGGDLPLGFEPVANVVAPPAVGPRRHLLFVFLESFRGDPVGRLHDGREITPFLNRLAREGGHSEHAYVHTPYTVGSRAQLFGGRLDFRHGQSTLGDDFQERGYRVAQFSGQDDQLGGSARYMGTERADVSYSARDDEALRTSRTTNQTALQVSWQTLSARVEEFLAGHDPSRPLFLYVNLVDTHFPYHHEQMENLLGVEPVSRHSFSAERADAIFATYANAAANVDRGIERIVRAWWSRMGPDAAIVVTADHGQSFYENGVLGHGQFLDDSHTRVPLVLWGIGGEWPEPVGLADLRGLLRRNLPLHSDDTVPRPRFAADPDRWIFQFGPRLERPRRIALRALDRRVEYVPASGRSVLSGFDDAVGPGGRPLEERMTTSLVHNWEALQLRLARPEEGP